MKIKPFVIISFIRGVILVLFWVQLSFAQGQISVQMTPDEGIQPRLLKDHNGDIHLLYFKKILNRPGIREGELYYRQYNQEPGNWSEKILVSTRPFNHQGSIGRAEFAIDGEGRIHVVWYQTRPNRYFYTRSNALRTNFQAQQSIVVDNLEGLDAGANIAASGNTVAIVWAAGDLSKEAQRTVYARFSRDNGFSFGAEQRISDPSLGACACCALAASLASDGVIKVAYRSAIDNSGRHMQVLTTGVKGDLLASVSPSYMQLQPLQEWELSACPVTTNDFVVENELNTWLIFETKSRIVQLNLADVSSLSHVGDPLTDTRQKNPALAFNANNHRLIVWGEVISFVKGGALNMQYYDAEGNKKSIAELGVEPGTVIPDYSFPAVVALKNGSFLVLL